MRRRLRLLLSAALLLGAPARPAAQAVAPPLTAGTGVFVERYDFQPAGAPGVERVSLVTLPFTARVPVVPRIELGVRGSYARGSLTRAGGGSTELSGLTDTELRATVEVVPQRLDVAAAVLLPTGSSRQTAEQAQLAGLVAADLLPFRISNWGAGGGAGAVTTLTLPLGTVNLGASAGYTVGREFQPLRDEDFAYRPGDEARLRVALDRTFGSAGKASLVLGLRHYADDRVAGAGVYRPGSRLEALASYAFAAGPDASGAAYAGVQHRAAGSFDAASLEVPAQQLFLAGGGLRLPAAGAVLVPAAEVRVFRRADGIDQGVLTTAGASLELRAGRDVLVVPAARGRFGRALLWEGASSSVHGFELSLGLRFDHQ